MHSVGFPPVLLSPDVSEHGKHLTVSALVCTTMCPGQEDGQCFMAPHQAPRLSAGAPQGGWGRGCIYKKYNLTGAQKGGEHLAEGSDVSVLLVPGLGQPWSGERST